MSLIKIDDPFTTVEEVKKNEISFGIDFGTTNSLICYFDEEEKIKYITDEEGELISSLFAIDKNFNTIFGNRCKNITDDYVVIKSIKSLIRQKKNTFKVFNKEVLVSEIIKSAFSHFSNLIDKKFTNILQKKAIITVPAQFDSIDRNLIRECATSCGFDVIRIINEPTAAAIAYNLENQSNCYLVYDLGGGTFDISVVKNLNGCLQVVFSAGDSEVGGDNYDQVISEKITNKNRFKTKFEFEEFCKDIKHFFSANPESKYKTENEEIKLSLFKEEFDFITQKTINIVKNCLQEVDEKIEGIILVGGATRMPWIQESLQQFNIPILNNLDKDKIVAIGAAKKADELVNKRNQKLTIDLTSLGIGIEIAEGMVDFVIQRNTPIPAKFKQTFTNQHQEQTAVLVNIFQGQRPFTKYCTKLASLKLPIEKCFPGLAKIEVTFTINVDGILSVIAKNLNTDYVQEVTVNPYHNLDNNDIKKVLLDSINHSSQDLEERLVLEEIENAKKMLLGVEKILQNSSLNADQIYKIKIQLEESIYAKNKQRIKDLCLEMEKILKPEVQKIMDENLKQILVNKKI